MYQGDVSVVNVMNALLEVYSLVAYPVLSFIIHDFRAATHIASGVAATTTMATLRQTPGRVNHVLKTVIITTDCD